MRNPQYMIQELMLGRLTAAMQVALHDGNGVVAVLTDDRAQLLEVPCAAQLMFHVHLFAAFRVMGGGSMPALRPGNVASACAAAPFSAADRMSACVAARDMGAGEFTCIELNARNVVVSGVPQGCWDRVMVRLEQQVEKLTKLGFSFGTRGPVSNV